ncbi:MAG: tetratricopeptide repeat protein [Gallionellaceae bacterium]
MSIIDDTFKRLGDEHSLPKGNSAAGKSAADTMAEIGFVVGPRKHYSGSLLLILVLAAGGVVIYMWPHKTETPSVSAQAQAVAAPPPPRQPLAAEAHEMIAQPSWYKAGWSAASAGEWPDAFLAWEGGVRGLPRDRVVIAGNSYADIKVFSAALRKYVKMFPAIGVRQRRHDGRTVYRLVGYPYGGGTRKALPRVQSVFSHAALVNVSTMQERMMDAKGARPAHEEVALKTDGRKMPQAGESEMPPGREHIEAANAAKPAAGAGAHLSAANRMSVAIVDMNVNDTREASTPSEANEWVYRSRAVREQLGEEAYAEAARNARALTREFPDRWESWFWLATAQLAQGQSDAAATALEHAAQLNPKVAQIWVQRAVVEQERGDHAAAVKLLNEARGLSPKSPQIYLNLGYSNDALGLSAEAEKNYQYFLSLTEGDVAYLLQRTLVIERLERKQE